MKGCFFFSSFFFLLITLSFSFYFFFVRACVTEREELVVEWHVWLFHFERSLLGYPTVSFHQLEMKER